MSRKTVKWIAAIIAAVFILGMFAGIVIDFAYAADTATSAQSKLNRIKRTRSKSLITQTARKRNLLRKRNVLNVRRSDCSQR